MKKQKVLLVAGVAAITLIGVSIISAYALSNNKEKDIAPDNIDYHSTTDVA